MSPHLQFCQLVSYMGDAAEEITLPTPAIIKPVPMWTGKQIFNLMIKPNDKSSINVNLEMKEKVRRAGEERKRNWWDCQLFRRF